MSLWSRLERRLGDLAGELVLDEYRDQLNQARALLARGDVPSALETLEALLKAKPDHGQALIALGDARLATRDPQHAYQAYERALQTRSGDPSALVGAGLALVELGGFEAAITPLNRAISEAVGDRAILADAYRGLGVAWRRRGDLDKAIRELRKAVVEDGDDALARAALGEALIADGGPLDEAMRHLERASKADEPPALALYALGRLALLEDVPAIAGAQLARARAALGKPTTPLVTLLELDILVAQGDAALAEHDAMRAHAFFLEALQLDPKRLDIHARIAAAHRSIGNLDAALASYDRVLSGAANVVVDVDVLRAAVDTAIAAGDAVRGAVWSGDLLARDPNDVRAITARGLALARDQPAAGRALLELAAARDDVDAHVALARLALATEPARAAGHARAALRVSPKHGAARTILADARAAELGTDRAAQLGPDAVAELVAFLERVVATRRDLGHHVGDLARAAASLDTPLLVTVMGEFSSGKSSFVNAFIGAEVAPTGITPTTATINVVRYGRERGGRILAHDGSALELGWDALMTHLRALTPDAARAIDRVEILVPLPQLEKINIVDTPGLNSIQPEHEATARAFIARADAIVWVFTAGQGGKASERAALQSIRDEGKRVLGVLNKADQLSADERREVVEFITGSLGELVEVVVPVSAREALADRTSGNWPALVGALEARFFEQARALKRDACARVIAQVIHDAQATLALVRQRAADAASQAQASRDELLASARDYADAAVTAERKQLSDQATGLYRRAAREVLDLVRPRRLPFASHTTTAADRDYLLALLASGFETAVEGGRRRVAADLATRSRLVEGASRALALATGEDVTGDLDRLAADRIGLAMSRVFDRSRAYLRGYLEGGYVESFFRNDVPKLELAEDAIYHALYRSAPDLDRELGEPLGRAAQDALGAVAHRLDHWSDVVDVQAFDLDVGIGRALELASARLRG
ncbi:MAG TPA: dynamin family protein [Kofleriaceae bacterium]|jgi:tetratricopeptide (TPR) repeat protein/GTPase SAR1 family protein